MASHQSQRSFMPDANTGQREPIARAPTGPSGRDSFRSNPVHKRLGLEAPVHTALPSNAVGDWNNLNFMPNGSVESPVHEYNNMDIFAHDFGANGGSTGESSRSAGPTRNGSDADLSIGRGFGGNSAGFGTAVGGAGGGFTGGADIAPWLTNDVESEGRERTPPAHEPSPPPPPKPALKQKAARKPTLATLHLNPWELAALDATSKPTHPPLSPNLGEGEVNQAGQKHLHQAPTPQMTAAAARFSKWDDGGHGLVPNLSQTSSRTVYQRNRSRNGSNESIATLGGSKQDRSGRRQVSEGRSPDRAANGRGARNDSSASVLGPTGSVHGGHADRKRGLSALTGLLKRKQGGPRDNLSEHRPSQGSLSSVVEPGTEHHDHQGGEQSGGPNPQTRGSDASSVHSQRHGLILGRRKGKKAASPEMTRPPHGHGQRDLHPDHAFELDTDLDHMEGIIDLTAGARPSSSGGFDPGASMSSSGSGSDQRAPGAPFTGGPMSRNGHGSASPSAESSTSRHVIQPADKSSQPFVHPDPFESPVDSDSAPGTQPPSPHTLRRPTESNQPRRPSQLRNVNVLDLAQKNRTESDSYGPQSKSSQLRSGQGRALFNTDPFGTMSGDKAKAATLDLPATPGTTLTGSSMPMLSPGSVEPHNSPFVAGAAAAFPPADTSGLQPVWTAPESWGVEGDEEPEDDPSSDEADEVDQDDLADQSTSLAGQSPSQVRKSIASDKRAPPPFGHGSVVRSRAMPTPRGSTAARLGSTASYARTGRPGTASSQMAVNHHIRIYSADGSYSAMSFPFATTTHDMLQAMSSRHLGPKGVMRLYIRERGQDRQLLASEKPVAIQYRRLIQAGYSDAKDKLEEMGRQNLTMLCRFIYQPPTLPTIDAEDEAAYDSFELVDLAGKNLQAIPIFLYRQAHTIISLNVSRNPLIDIPLDFVQACTALRELRMTYMAMKRIPSSIRQSMALTRLDISCNRIVELEHVGLHDIPTLVSLKVQNNRLSSLPDTFALMKGLKYLNISNNSFTAFPHIVCKMSSLMDLDVSFNEITELPSELCQLSALERLVAVGNTLVTFPESFSRLASLRELDVRRNRLTDLTAVYALPQLAMLQADSNQLTALDTQLGSKVREFAVPRNNLTRFTLAPLAAASAGYALTTLDLSYAKLSTLADDALGQLLNLETLVLNSNKFARLPETLINLTNLRSLSCTDNVLTSLPSGLGKLELLRVLSVHNNNLQDLPSSIWNCRSLVTLNASSNLLSVFPDPPVSETLAARDNGIRKASMVSDTSNKASSSSPPLGLSLRKLYLIDNQLTDDVFDPVSLMPELRLLNVGYNDIFEIPTGTLARNSQLEELYLSGNNLTTLPSEDLEQLTNLRLLHVNSNKLQTLPAELGKIRNLTTLDVGCNVLKYNIANWPYDWNWNWNLELRYLNLSGNKRLEIKPTSQNDPHVASNFRRDLSDFSKLTQLKILGLMDVTLRIPFLPDESEDRRVRTSFSEVNNMAYGIADTLGRIDHPSMFDLVVPNFRSREDECLFGLFGRAHPNVNKGKVAKFLQETFTHSFTDELERITPDEQVPDALRRTFLGVNKSCYDFLAGSDRIRKGSVASGMTMEANTVPSGSLHSPAYQLRSGASGGAIYMVDKRMYVAGAGHVLAVISSKGEAELLAVAHHPMVPEETARIRAAEAWVSPRGLVNDELDVSRSFGFYNHVPAVNALPDVFVRDLTEADEFVIFANKALWDHCSPQVAVDIARTKRDDPMAAAHKLRDFAMSYGADGGAMVMVICVADLFRMRGMRGRGQAALDKDGAAADGDAYYGGQKRVGRRRGEEGVGDRTLLRLQQEVEPPTGLVALVFTDIKNSTSLWETNPGMQTAMRMHNSLLRRQLRIIGGYEVKTEGDAFMVSFPTITSAVLWCVTCQMQLLLEDWPTEILDCEDGREIRDSNGIVIQRGLSVRMGLHWGLPVWEKDPITGRMDYFGPMVNKSSRVSASADGGQIMGSLDVIKGLRGLIEDENLPGGMTNDPNELPLQDGSDASQLKRMQLGITDMGERKLKGLEVPEKLFLIHPKSLAGRLEISRQLRENIEATPLKSADERLIEAEEVKQLIDVCLRLEHLSSKSSHNESNPDGMMSTSPSTGKRGKDTYGGKLRHPHYLGPRIKDDMTDEDMVVILQSLVTRIENACSSLLLHQVGDFHGTLVALAALLSTGPSSLINALSSFQHILNHV